MRAVLALGFCLMLSGCALPDPDDLIPDEEAAIRRAKEVCKWEKPRTPDERWVADFENGRWRVWNGSPSRAEHPSDVDRYPQENSLYVEIIPQDGSTNEECGTLLVLD